MSLGILALKIGLVAGVTGVSIATPILLNRKGADSSVVAAQTDSDQPNSLGGGGQEQKKELT